MSTVKDLLDLIEKEESILNAAPKEVEVKPYQNSTVNNFIKKLGVGGGSNRVPTHIIYYHYAQWAVTSGHKTWKKEEFFRTFKQHFEQRRTGRQRYYLLNDALDLSPETYLKAEKYDERYKKRKSKREGKVSSPQKEP